MMARNYYAYQFERSPQGLGNWESQKRTTKVPKASTGCTSFIADDQGHLLPSIARSNQNPWGDFIGTWDLPNRIPGIVNTVAFTQGASQDYQDRLAHFKEIIDKKRHFK